jgi:hypothetical protein
MFRRILPMLVRGLLGVQLEVFPLAPVFHRSNHTLIIEGQLVIVFIRIRMESFCLVCSHEFLLVQIISRRTTVYTHGSLNINHK